MRPVDPGQYKDDIKEFGEEDDIKAEGPEVPEDPERKDSSTSSRKISSGK